MGVGVVFAALIVGTARNPFVKAHAILGQAWTENCITTLGFALRNDAEADNWMMFMMNWVEMLAG